MDNFWIFIIIIGAVMSLAQKGQKKPAEEVDDTPQPADPHKEFERRIREILNEQKFDSTPAQNKAESPARHTTAPASRPTLSPRPEPMLQSASRPKSTAAKYSHRPAGNQELLYKNKTASLSHQTTSTQPASRQNNDESREIDKIIDDFTMEKAVIYAEILKPKYEEY